MSGDLHFQGMPPLAHSRGGGAPRRKPAIFSIFILATFDSPQGLSWPEETMLPHAFGDIHSHAPPSTPGIDLEAPERCPKAKRGQPLDAGVTPVPLRCTLFSLLFVFQVKCP